MITLRGTLITAAAAAAALASWWLYRAVQPPPPPAAEAASHAPDYWFEGFTLTGMGVDGNPRHRISGRRMTHHPADDTSRVAEPVITVFRADGPPWRIDAERGWVAPRAEEVRLLGAVTVDRAAAADAMGIHALTRDVTVFPARDYAETAEPVTITSDGITVTSVGMRAWLARGRVVLLSDVRGEYLASARN